MSMKFKISDFKSVTLKKIDPPNSDKTLQIEPYYAEEGTAKAKWQVDGQFENANGVIMGGYLSAATDTIMAYAISTLVSEDKYFVSIDLHTTFHRPLLAGEAEVVAKVERKGGKIAYLTADVYQNGKKCCSSVSSMMILKRQ